MVAGVYVDNSATAANPGNLRGLVDVDKMLKSGSGLVCPEWCRFVSGWCPGVRWGVPGDVACWLPAGVEGVAS